MIRLEIKNYIMILTGKHLASEKTPTRSRKRDRTS